MIRQVSESPKKHIYIMAYYKNTRNAASKEL